MGRTWGAALVAAAVVAVLGPAQAAGASAGAADPGFGAGGVVQTDVSGLDVGLDVLVQPDGKAVTIGFAESDGILLRHRADGTLDPTFGVGGVVRTSPPASFEAGALQADGRIVAVGSNGTLDDVVLRRFLPSGAPDPAFGAGGVVVSDFGGVDQGRAVTIQPDGKLVVAGRTDDALLVARYLPNGSPDPLFGTGGRTTTTFGAGSSSEADAVAILSTGGIVVGGLTGPSATGDVSMLLARYGPGGLLDGTYGTGGLVAPADRRMAVAEALVVQPGDRVVVAGSSGDEMAQEPRLARYLAGGSLDASFGTGGTTVTPLGARSSHQDLTLDAAGRLLAAGSTSFALPGAEPAAFSFVTVSRFSADGIVDPAFGCAGTTQVEVAAAGGGRSTGIGVAADGRILVGGVAFTDPATDFGRPDFLLVRLLATGSAPPAGYWIARADGGVSAFGTAGGCGSPRGLALNTPIVGHAGRASGDGYWLVASDGGIFAHGDAPFLGSAGGLPLNRPIVGMAATPGADGYRLVASDGGVFAYGDAGFFGSTGGITLNRPVVGMAATPGGKGYWLVASDGGVFAYGDAGFFGSTGGITLNRPVVGMAATPSGKGYWLVASDGGVFAYGDAGFFGSTGGTVLNRPVVGMKASPSGAGYWLAATDGGVFAFGPPFLGSTGSQPFRAPAVAIS